MLAQPAQAQFSDYRTFYRSLGDNLFDGSGQELAMPCTASPRKCIWVNAMRAAVVGQEQEEWVVPDGLSMAPEKNDPDMAFDGEALVVDKRRWSLRDAIDRAPETWRGRDPIDPESLERVTYWQNGSSICLELQYVSSGKGDRYTGVLLLHHRSLYVLPPLFASCSAVRKTPRNQFIYPRNRYTGPAQENHPEGLEVDYVRFDGKSTGERYRLSFPDPDDPFVFDLEP
ncbi:hypothetical protein [Pseudomonas schmalbachii]|uniref:Uncharacterized protein n=1 Tax=Pseudomonas schmalbachii TaxID=2816993 RepID=A0ABS3TM10_9PSED|nr:hypothetical protein [Pseudomonas schmalbachii]MBO3274701.1 hypothetical protein [Pseudomonas schmalbachii]